MLSILSVNKENNPIPIKVFILYLKTPLCKDKTILNELFFNLLKKKK